MFKNARKIIMGATLALVMGVSVVGVNAETPSNEKNPFKQETDINITVEQGTIEEPGDGGDGGDGGSSKGDLAIWLKPSKMNFAGKYKETGYTLPLTKNGGEGTEDEFDTRQIAVADIRGEKIGWTLKGQLSSLKSDYSDDLIKSGYSMSMNVQKHGKYKMNEQKEDELVRPLVLTDNDNDVEVNSNIVLNPSEAVKIANTKDTTRPGKLYTGFILEDINMHFEAGVGSEGTLTGQVEWTLSDSVE